MPSLSDAQRLFFEANGYLVLPDVLDAGDLDRLRAACARAEERWRGDPSLPGHRRHDLEQVLGIMEYDPIFVDLLEHPRVFPRVRELLGPDVMMLDHDYFITPTGTTVPHGWHVDLDLQGVDHPRSRLMVKVFYVLEDVPPDGGATLLLPGSHRWGPEVEVPDPELPEDMPGAVAMDLSAGSAYLFTGRTRHSAGTNASDRVRRVLIYNYGHKWMRVWQSYEPSAALERQACTPMRRQLLGLTDPYGMDHAPYPPSAAAEDAAA